MKAMCPKYKKAKSYLDYLKEDKTLSPEEKQYSAECFRGAVQLFTNKIRLKKQPPYITKHF